MNKIYTVVAVMILLVIAGFAFVNDNKEVSGGINTPEEVFCTTEAKLCPDGSYVGRTGPNCEFSACPVSATTSHGEKITAKISERILQNGVYITPLDILEDSRCAEDVTCIWAGTVAVKVLLERNLAKKEVTIKLNEPTVFEGKNISLENVYPKAHSERKILDRDYVLSFKVI